MSLSYIKYIFSFILISCAFALNAQGQQQGVIDTTFNARDHGYDYGKGTEDNAFLGETVRSVGIQSDGKIILAGGFNSYNGALVNGIVRTLQDGRIDTSFQSGTGLIGSAWACEIDSNNNIFLAGFFISYNGTPVSNIIKLLPNGILDTSFDAGTGATGTLYCMDIQSNGKIVAGGGFTSFNGVNTGNLVRLNVDGSVDTSYITGLGTNSSITDLRIQPDGKCVLVGHFTSFNNMSSPRIARININGTLDSAFMANVGIGFTSPSFTPRTTGVDIQANGRIVVVGSFLGFNNTTASSMVRIFPNGTRDMSFNPNSSGWMESVEVLPNQKFIVTGSSNNINGHSSNRIFRFNATGFIDVNFTVDEIEGDFGAIKTQANNRTIVGGIGSRFGVNRNIYRLRPNGTLDTTFNVITGFDGGVTQILEKKDGSVLVAGGFGEYNKTQQRRIVQIHPNGSIDTSFVGWFNSTTFTMAELDSGKVLIGGAYATYKGQSSGWLTKVLPNGDRDNSFNLFSSSQTNSFPYEIAVQPNGKILVGGYFGTGSGASYDPLYRINANGSKDNTFNSVVLNSTVLAIELQPDKRIIVGGAFANRNRIVRLFENGSIDNSFAVGTGANDIVRDIKRQYDGRVIVCGFFDEFNGQPAGRIVRLFPDGQIDSTFNAGSGADSTVRSISLQSNEKIVLTGDFSSFNGIMCNGVVRLNNDGTVDSTFFLGDGANNYVLTSTVLQNGDIMIGGGFTAYQGIGRNRIARLGGDGCIVKRITDTIMACDDYTWIDGNTYTSSTTLPKVTYQGSYGCDSVVHLNLTIDTLTARAVLNGFTLAAVSNTIDDYQWIDCLNNDSIIPGATNKLFNPQKNGSYAVIITRGGCVDTSACVTVSGINVLEYSQESMINLFPNPAVRSVVIESEKEGFYQFISSDGRVCLIGNLTANSQEVDISMLSPGIYSVIIETSSRQVVRKLVVSPN